MVFANALTMNMIITVLKIYLLFSCFTCIVFLLLLSAYSRWHGDEPENIILYVFVVIVWKGISSGLYRQTQNWARAFILLLPQAAVLPGSDAGRDVLIQHLVLLSKTVRSRAPCGAR